MTTQTGARRPVPWRLLGWSVPVILLLQPVLWRFPWTLSDFVLMGAMMAVTGLLIELAFRASGHAAYRGGASLAVLAGFLLLWVDGAVGILGNEDNPANLLFLGVPVVALLGAWLAGFRAGGMARAMLAAFLALVAVCALALAAGWVPPGAQGLRDAAMGAGVFGAPWLLAAFLFRRAARMNG